MNGNNSSSAIDKNNAVMNINNIIFTEPIILSDPKMIYTSIKYTVLQDYSAFTNILLVDNAVTNHNDFVKNSNLNTFPIIYDYSSKSDELGTFIATNFKNITCIGLIFDGKHMQTTTKFINGFPFFNNNDLIATNINNLSVGVKFIVDLINQLSIKNIDYLACGTLRSDKWVNYYSQINKFTKTRLNQLGVVVGASNDITGNIKYGCDWTTESDSENVELIYFKNHMTNYANTLGIQSSSISACGIVYIKQLLNDIHSFSFGEVIYDVDPLFKNAKKIIWYYGSSVGCGVNNEDAEQTTLIVKFTSEIDIQIIPDGINGYVSAQNIFFVCNSKNITFDGNFNNIDCVITVDSCSSVSYPGFIKNGDYGGNRYDYITVQNIIVNSVNSFSILYSDSNAVGGWICQAYFGTSTCNVNNCSSNAPINSGTKSEVRGGGGSGGRGGGGILGDYCVAKVNNCYSMGVIGEKAGGIFGLGAGSSNSNGNITVPTINSYSTETISDLTGDIFDFQSGYFNSGRTTTVTAINCYSEGIILDSGGGIFGANAGSYNFCGYVNIIASNCYSTGTILGAGGIFGFGAGNNNSDGKITITANKCFSTGSINSYAGGIFGDNAGYNNTGGTIEITAINCYSTGTINSYAGGIFGDNAASSNYSGKITVIAKNSYSTGAMSDNFSGGIFGANAGTFNTHSTLKVRAINCYTSGLGTKNNGIFGQYSNVVTNNCYAETYNGDSQWNTSNAQTVLENYNTILSVDTVWLNINLYNDTPFLLYGSDPNYNNINFYATSSATINTNIPTNLVKQKDSGDNFFWIIPPHLIQLLIIRRDV